MLRCGVMVLAALLLQGCLQVELGGPVSGASVSIVELRSGRVIQAGLLTKTTAQRQADYSADQWSGFSARVRMLLSGTVDVPANRLNDDTYYLVTARGGQDLDPTGSGQPAFMARAVAGQWHAIMTGAQLRGPLVRVNTLTESIYQSVKNDLADLDDEDLAVRLDTLAKRVLDDVNSDGQRNYADVLIWSNLTEQFPYRGQSVFTSRLIASITEGHDASIIRDRGLHTVDYVNWHVARPQGDYQKQLIPCAAVVIIRDLCTFSRMPLLRMDSATPSVDQIMQRLIVSHDWMAVRFEEMLHQMPADMLKLMGSLTTITIGADIRPSYYSPVTAGIFLDAGTFWVSAKEYETVSKEEDYRVAFGRKVAFSDLWRYAKGAQRAYDRQVDDNGNRDAESVRFAAASLLFHELAHAYDYFPATRPLSRFVTPYSQLSSNKRLSETLQELMPLTSTQLVAMGQVLYQGTEPTAEQKVVTAKRVGDMFSADGASDLYAYSTSAEDFAMLFEESMMRIHYGFEREVAFTNSPADPDSAKCADYIVAWGVRGRVGTPHVKQRAQWVMNQVLPERTAAVVAFPAQTAMTTNQDWCAHLQVMPTPYLPGLLMYQGKSEPVYQHRHR